MNTDRYESIDQFRGFAILSMVLVNVVGRFRITPEIFRHARFERFSFADSVAPFFFFIVGAGFRMSFLRNQSKQGTTIALMISLKRSLLLMVIAIFVYHFNMRRIFWDALSQIAFGSLIALPVIGAGKSYRVLLPFIYAGVLLAIGKIKILGVPFELESASWPLMILMGSIAGDWLLEGKAGFARKTLLCGAILLGLGVIVYFFAPPTVAACALIYLGLAFLLFDMFYHVVDVWKMPLPHLTTLGRNALVVYILHYYIDDDMKRLVPDEAGIAMVILTFAVVYIGCYSVAQYLQDRKYFVTV